ncbi:MAG: ABC transporter substrate-binding protein [Bacteroidota bacterium]
MNKISQSLPLELVRKLIIRLQTAFCPSLCVEKMLVYPDRLDFFALIEKKIARFRSKDQNPNKLLVLFLFATLFLLTDCRTDPKVEEEDKVEYKRMVNEVVVAASVDADNLNPVLTSSSVTIDLLNQMFQTLQVINPENLEMTPLLAKSEPIISDFENGVAYTFEIRDNAVWPNGTSITGKDVEFSMKAILNPKVPSPHRVNLSPIGAFSIDENNPKKFTISMKERNIRSEEIASASFYVIPAYHYDPQNLLGSILIQDLLDPSKADQLASSDPNLQIFADEFIKPKYAREAGGIVGSGPYQFEEWVTGQRIVLSKKEDWWADGIEENVYFGNNVDKIIYQPIEDDNVAVAAMQNEEIDVITGLTPDAYKAMKTDEIINKSYNVITAPRHVTGFWYINTENPKLSDKRVRRALAHLVNVQSVIDNILDMPLDRIVTPILPSMPGYDSSLKPIEFNVEKAKALLKEAGWEDSNNNGIVDKMINGELVEMNLQLLASASRQTQLDQGQLVKDDAIQAGVNIEVISQEFNVVIDNVKKKTYELSLGAIGERTPYAYDPYQAWHTASAPPNGSNRVGFGNAETDALIEKIRTTVDEEERKKLYKEFQQVIYDEQPMIFLYEVPNFLAIHKRFNSEGFNYTPNYFIGDFDISRK